MGDPAPALNCAEVVKGLGIKFVEVVDSYNVKDLTEVFKRALAFDGIAVVVSKHPCAIIEARARRKGGAHKSEYAVDQDLCSKCLTCIRTLGCPAFFVEGKDVFINENLCEGCGVCVSVCPKKAIAKKGGE